MLSLPVPSRDARSAYLTCISRVRDPELRGALGSLTRSVGKASEIFERAVTDTQLHLLDRQDFTPANRQLRDELINTYKSRMVDDGSPGRQIYNELRHTSRCPLCGHRDVTTLDHHLPKSEYPLLSVNPKNLVPACGECNKIKANKFPTCSEDHTLHPYYDDIDSDRWLIAEVVEQIPVAVTFRVEPPAEWSSTLVARVRHHFATFKLAALYGSQAATELVAISYDMQTLFDVGGSIEIQNFVAQRAAGRAMRLPNHWATALYAALAVSPWYCEGGFAFDL